MSAKIPISSIPELMAIWDWSTNTVSPDDLGKRSNTKVWWICPNGHEHYQQSPRQKMQQTGGCPKCNIEKRVQARNAEVLKQKGSIVKTHPHMLREWDYDKNTVSPELVLAGSHIKYWWKCSRCGQSYLMSPNMRSSKERGCPDCGIKTRGKAKRNNLLKKYGSLSETHPLLADEWDYGKNADRPSDVHQGMPDMRWWICNCGHSSYRQSIRDRARRGYSCPQCQGENQTSFPEQAIFYYIKKEFPDALNRYNDNGFEIDIYIPCLKTGLEYDGSFWHRNKQTSEKRKDEYFTLHGIQIIRIKETKDDNLLNQKETIWVKATSDYSYLDLVIKEIALRLGVDIDNIDIKRDAQTIWAEYLTKKAENSLQGKYPHVAAEWDYAWNIITPDKVTPYSRKKVHWVCPDCGNNYQMAIGDRTGSKKCGCPKCGRKRRNDMQSQAKDNNKQIIAEYRLNNPDATISSCSRAIGLSYPTVKKYWDCDKTK